MTIDLEEMRSLAEVKKAKKQYEADWNQCFKDLSKARNKLWDGYTIMINAQKHGKEGQDPHDSKVLKDLIDKLENCRKEIEHAVDRLDMMLGN